MLRSLVRILLRSLVRSSSFLLVIGVVAGGVWMANQTRPQPAQTSAPGVAAHAAATPLPVTATKGIRSTPLPTEYAILDAAAEVQATAYTAHCAARTAEQPYSRAVCSAIKLDLLRSEYAQFYATATAAAPTHYPNATAWVPRTPSPYILTDKDRVVAPIDRGGIIGSGPQSIWKLGVVVGRHGEPYGLRLWADECHRGTERTFDSCLGMNYLPSPNSPYEWDPAYMNKVWYMPQVIGHPTITAVSAQQGIVSFVGEHGERGTFDLATETWTFDSSPPTVATAVVAAP